MSLVDLGKRLLEAAKRGETEEVRTLMSNGAPFTTDWLGTSPLHFAAQYGHNYTAEVLLRAGISRDARTKVDRTPLHVASQEGHAEIVDLLLQHSADIDAKDMLKMTPLHWSTEKGHTMVIETLLKHGADVNCENKFDRTPLDIAIINGRPDIVQLLQLAQHTAIGNLTEPSETVTVETSEIPGEDSIITEGETITIEGTEFSPSRGDDATDGSSTSVLATLAALAEATAPNNTSSVSTSEAMDWLESQGITMITTADGSIITSAVESGQTITLTEAGKIALNIIKQQGLAAGTEEEEVEGEVLEETILKQEEIAPEDQDVEQKVHEQQEQTHDNVITIVTQSGDGMVTGEENTLTVLPLETEEDDIMPISVNTTDDLDEPQVKKMALDPNQELDITNLLQQEHKENGGGGDADTDVGMAATEISEDQEEVTDQDDLKKELEQIRRQAEQFKAQLKQKDKDLEEYKKQLSQMVDKTPVDSASKS